jgi:hypothetical protein
MFKAALHFCLRSALSPIQHRLGKPRQTCGSSRSWRRMVTAGALPIAWFGILG